MLFDTIDYYLQQYDSNHMLLTGTLTTFPYLPPQGERTRCQEEPC